MNQIRGAARLIGRLTVGMLEGFRGDPDSSEGAVNLGLLGLGAGLLVAGEPALALIAPSVLLVILGSLPAIAKVRGH